MNAEVRGGGFRRGIRDPPGMPTLTALRLAILVGPGLGLDRDANEGYGELSLESLGARTLASKVSELTQNLGVECRASA